VPARQAFSVSDILRSVHKLTRYCLLMRIFLLPKKNHPFVLLLACFVTTFMSSQAQANQPVESFLWKASAAATAALIATTNPIKADRISGEVGGGEHVYVIVWLELGHLLAVRFFQMAKYA
jgi:hypothetical protein